MNKRWRLILVILLALAIPVAVYAATVFTRTIPNSAEIVAPPGPGPQANLQVYSNAGATQEITELAWGPVTAGTQATKTVWVKNTGQIPYTIVNLTTTLSPAVGSYTATPTDYPLAVGEKKEVVLTLALQVGATPGPINWDVNFEGTTQ